MDEQAFVVQQFQRAFTKWRDEPFVLYGLGKNTEAILKRCEGFQFAGLMDARNTGGEFWGLKVLSEKEVVDINPRVVIIARESVVPVIYERIAYLQKENGLRIYNYKGELQGQKKEKYNNQNLPYWDMTEESLRSAIDAHSCISFDIFDTLLMRRVLEPTDVFEIAERILEKRGYEGNKFQEYRIQAERELSGYPTLRVIYEKMGSLCHLSNDVLERWMQLEIELEEAVLVPRLKMVELFHYALKQGKKVFLVSDMYLSAKELEKFLNKYGIEGYDGLLVSCDYQKGKEDGSLYDVYKDMAGDRSCLHIGDNRRSDGERARERGLDTFQVYSAYEMWMASSMQVTLAHVETLEQRCILGNLIWKRCENPFALHEGKGYVIVNSPQEIGYFFLGALYDGFILWLKNRLQEKETEQLLLPARDGFLIGQLLAGEESLSFEPVYFKASRRAVSVAAIESQEDILFLANRGFQGTYGELLWRRFGIKPGEQDEKKDHEVKGEDSESIREYVLTYQNEILLRAQKEREEYLAYLRTCNLFNEKEQAIFDFVAGGTVQYFIQKLLGKKLKGLYFATMNHPVEGYHLEDAIVSAYGNISSYVSENQVAKHYLFLEAIMVDGYSTLRCVEDGHFVYETREDNELLAISEVQAGILNYKKDILEMRRLVPDWKGERYFADELFGRLFDGSCQVNRAIKRAFRNDDVFDGIETYQVWSE